MSDIRTIKGNIKQLAGNDPDVLYATKKQWIAGYRAMQMSGILIALFGVPLTFVIVGVFMIPIGIFMFFYCRGEIKKTEIAFDEYCRELGIESV